MIHVSHLQVSFDPQLGPWSLDSLLFLISQPSCDSVTMKLNLQSWSGSATAKVFLLLYFHGQSLPLHNFKHQIWSLPCFWYLLQVCCQTYYLLPTRFLIAPSSIVSLRLAIDFTFSIWFLHCPLRLSFLHPDFFASSMGGATQKRQIRICVSKYGALPKFNFGILVKLPFHLLVTTFLLCHGILILDYQPEPSIFCTLHSFVPFCQSLPTVCKSFKVQSFVNHSRFRIWAPAWWYFCFASMNAFF